MAARDPHLDQYMECEKLYYQLKLTECTQLALKHLKDPTLPLPFKIKTLVLLSVAERSNWYDAERYRVQGEEIYAAIKKRLGKRGPAAAAEAELEMQSLRGGLDKCMEHQAKAAPPSSLRHARYPGREGCLEDYLYERELIRGILEEEDEEEEAEVVEGTEEKGKEVDDEALLREEEAVHAAVAEVLREDEAIARIVCEFKEVAVEDAVVKGMGELDLEDAKGDGETLPIEDEVLQALEAAVRRNDEVIAYLRELKLKLTQGIF